jgi:branched-chain amino acid transport system permease protein
MKNQALALLGAAACVVLALVAPLDDYLIKLLMQAATYAIAVLGLTIVLGYTGQISLAQAAFFGIGAYGVALGSSSLGLPFFAALALGTLLAGGFGVLLGGSTLKLGGHYLAMVTISFQEILTLVLTNWVGLTHGPDGVANIPRPAGLVAAPRYLALCLVVLFATAWVVAALKRRPLGLAMQAVRDNELAASVVGVNTYRVKIIAFALSALLGGLGGGLFAGAFRYISPDQFSFDDSVVLLTMALLGGVEAAAGSVIGTALLVLLPEWLRFLRQFYLAVYGLAVILIMVFMPAGIWGFIAGLRPRRVAMPPPGGLVLGRAAGDGALLEVVGLAKHFGGLRAVDGVDLRVRAGEVHALIGPNGSGKTTTLNVLSGLYRPTGGSVRLAGREVAGQAPHLLAAAGLGRTFQNIRLFHSLTAFENVLIGAQAAGGAPAARATARGHPM